MSGGVGGGRLGRPPIPIAIGAVRWFGSLYLTTNSVDLQLIVEYNVY